MTSSSSGQVPSDDQTDAAAAVRRRRHAKGRSAQAELDCYLNTWFEFPDNFAGTEFNILEWWSRRAGEFPTLSRLARSALAIPISTNPVDRSFTEEGKILNERHSTL
jgi:hypothetical protein